MKSFHSRRTFLQTGLAAGTALALPSRSLLAASANEQINVGLIGCGGRGEHLVSRCSRVPGMKVVGLCDPDSERTGKLGEKYTSATKYTDLRKMLESKDLDAVVVATCNHWHGLAAILAMQAGKHVYVEKPLSQTQWEGRQVVNAAHKFNRICQIGTQQRTDPMQAEIKKFLHEEKKIGEIRWVQVNRYGKRASIGKRDTPLAPPKSVDYDLWLGPAQNVPMYRENFHYDWHWVWNTGSGEMGNWGVHIVDDVRNNVFRDEVKMPSQFIAAGGRFGWHDAGNTPNLHFAALNAGGIPVTIGICNLEMDEAIRESAGMNGPTSGYVVHCEGGRFEGQRGHATAFDAEGQVIAKFGGRGGEAKGNHQQNFADAIRANDPLLLNAPIQEGYYSTGWCNLANVGAQVAQQSEKTKIEDAVSTLDTPELGQVFQGLQRVCEQHGGATSDFQLGPMLDFDTSVEQFTGETAELANSFLRDDNYRKGFAVPEIEGTKVAAG
ncbi:Gfo/Idh/MocA family protein [Adhaeretor mobilis]|uniref:4-carboxy-2-hydroxymuconate-6-semialdehyde dehydrogenase n=1 Tax=Adhaeretor mobilis TaxID=1930276 RepID=A0A517N2S0_9BACT|nr:Gfo/Idh/MocA family oxidoreductase [Adhaeretor mobilis]QDT01436.1 4-carboxy-2-hydroxymuconate-6-semialdehyde dehydrogenase [Adhaeretor mobilis]